MILGTCPMSRADPEVFSDRVKTLLGKLKSMRRSKERGYNASKELRHTSHKFVRRVEKIFKNLPNTLEWLSFLNHDLPLLIDFCEEVQKASTQHRLNKSQIRALEKLKAASEQEFQRVTAHAERAPNSEMGHVRKDFWQRDLRDMSAREIEDIADKAVKKETLKKLKRARVSPSLSLEAKIFMMSRFGIPANRIAAIYSVQLKSFFHTRMFHRCQVPARIGLGKK